MTRFRWFPLILSLLLFTGCGLGLQPRNAEYQRYSGPGLAAGDIAVTASVDKGQSLLEVLQRYTFPAWLPKAPVDLPEVRGGSLGPVPLGRTWVEYWTLDGRAVLSPPAGYATGLGLVVDQDGRVLGNKPFIDLGRGLRPSQEPWGGRMRGLFAPTTPYLVDLFQFDLVYGGLDPGPNGGDILLLQRDFKHGGPGAADWAEVRMKPGQSRQFQGVTVRIIEAGPDDLTYNLQVPAEAR